MPIPAPFGPTQIYSKISFPAFNILDALIFQTGELSYGFSAVSDPQLATISGASTPTKPFIVGFIPPDFAVNFVPVIKTQNTLTTSGFTATSAGPTSPVPVPSGYNTAMQHSPAFYQGLAQVAKTIHANPADMLAVMMRESNTNPGAINHPLLSNGTRDTSTIQAAGLIQFTNAPLKGIAQATNMPGLTLEQISQMSDIQQLPLVQAYYQNSNYGGSYPTTGSLYLANAAPAFMSHANDPNFVVYSNDGLHGSVNNYNQNKGLDPNGTGNITVGNLTNAMDSTKQTPAYMQQLTALNAATNMNYQTQTPNPTIPSSTANPTATTTVMTNAILTDPSNPTSGQGKANNAIGGNSQAIDTTRLAAVNAQTNYLQEQIANIQTTPALMMLVNPSEFTRSYEHTVDPVKARAGYVVNMWLEKPIVITSKGVTPAQYAFQSDGSGGLVTFNRIQSASYQNLMSLVLMFKNNGYIFTDTSFGNSNAGIPLIAVSIYIYYDNHIYIGSFDEFDLTDDGTKPYNLSYSWKFTVRYDIDITSISDSFISNFGQAGKSGFVPSGAAPQGVGLPTSPFL